VGGKKRVARRNCAKKILNIDLELNSSLDRHDWSRTRWNLFLVKRQDRNTSCLKGKALNRNNKKQQQNYKKEQEKKGKGRKGKSARPAASNDDAKETHQLRPFQRFQLTTQAATFTLTRFPLATTTTTNNNGR